MRRTRLASEVREWRSDDRPPRDLSRCAPAQRRAAPRSRRRRARGVRRQGQCLRPRTGPVARAIEPFAARLCVYTHRRGAGAARGRHHRTDSGLGTVRPRRSTTRSRPTWRSCSGAPESSPRRLAANARRREQERSGARQGQYRSQPSGLRAERGRRRRSRTLGRMPEIAIAGIFSHLASAEELDSPYTMHQLDAFERAIAQAKPVIERMTRPPLRHIAASAAAMLWPQTRLDMVRFGIALYGLMPSPQTREALGASALDLRPALSYRIADRRDAHDPRRRFGRIRRHAFTRRARCASASFRPATPTACRARSRTAAAFAVDGALCPIVGRVAMNMTRDRSHRARASARVGSTGHADRPRWRRRGRRRRLGALGDTISYEIVTRLPSELRREYTRAANELGDGRDRLLQIERAVVERAADDARIDRDRNGTLELAQVVDVARAAARGNFHRRRRWRPRVSASIS